MASESTSTQEAEKLTWIAQTLESKGWEKVIMPALLAMRDAQIGALINSPETPEIEAERRALIKLTLWFLAWNTKRDQILEQIAAMVSGSKQPGQQIVRSLYDIEADALKNNPA